MITVNLPSTNNTVWRQEPEEWGGGRAGREKGMILFELLQELSQICVCVCVKVKEAKVLVLGLDSS